MLAHANSIMAFQISTQRLGAADLRPAFQPLNDFLRLGIQMNRQFAKLLSGLMAQQNLGHG